MLISIANPVIPPPADRALWAYWMPRIVHDVLALWSIAFRIWAVVDAYIVPEKNKAVKQEASGTAQNTTPG